MQGRCDFECACWQRGDEVLVPRLASISQSVVNMPLSPFLQVVDLRVYDTIWELAHVLLQPSIHQLEAANQELRVMIGEGDVEPWIGTPGWIDDEVGKGSMEGSNRLIDVVLEGEERVNRQQEGEYLFGIKPQERSNGGWRKGVHS